MECEHDWVYSSYCYTVSPPLWDRICSKCLEEEHLVPTPREPTANTYAALKRKKQFREEAEFRLLHSGA